MIRIFKLTGFLIIPILLLFSACSKKKSTKPQPPTYKWTILGYFDGNNPQDETPDGYSYVIRDVQELEETGSSDSVQIVVMLGSTETGGDCKYYHIEKHINEPEGTISSSVLQDLGKKDMSDYTTLRDFIGYTMQNYPAEHYMLIIDDHGLGWKGLCSDNVNGSGAWMSLPDLSSALLGFEFDIIWLYSPSMATAEVAYQIKDRAEYLIASQFKNYPDNIIGSSYWLPGLVDDPLMNVRLFVLDVVNGIDSAAYNISPDKKFHSSLIHLTRVSQLGEDVSDLGRNIVDLAGAYWSEVWDAWKVSNLYTLSESTYIDLREFAIQIQNRPNLNATIKNSAAQVENTLSGSDRVLLKEVEYPTYDFTSGLSIHLPWNHDDFDSLNYDPLDISNSDWPEFISNFTQSYLNSYAGSLLITSNVKGARIIIDGIDTGYETDAVIDGLYPGQHGVSLVKTGYCQQVQDPMPVSVISRKTLSVLIMLLSCKN